MTATNPLPAILAPREGRYPLTPPRSYPSFAHGGDLEVDHLRDVASSSQLRVQCSKLDSGGFVECPKSQTIDPFR
jgi:hypothetical protein